MIKPKSDKIKPLILVLILAFLLGISLAKAIYADYRSTLKQSPNVDHLNSDITQAIGNVNLSAIKSHVKKFSSFKSRVVGYPGYYEATNYIIREFKSYGVNVIVQNYTSAVPIDEGSYIILESSNTKITAYSLWPNGVQACSTPPEGISGKLIYVGNGSLEQFNGHDVNGSIVLMDFNSGENWINAAELGAKAVIFLAPSETDFIESLKKAIPVPINFPRLYVDPAESSVLKEAALKEEIVTVHNNIRWKNVVAYNIIAIINGTQHPDDVMIISAHYDSWSIVPAIAPGAEDSLSISSFLELARYFASNKPSRTLWFVAFSGYYEGNIGIIEWIEQNFYSPEISSGSKRLWLQAHLDLSTESDTLDALYIGPPLWFGSTTYGVVKFSVIQRLIRDYLRVANLAEIVNTNPLVHSNFVWGTQQPIRDVDWFYYLPTQYIVQTGVEGFTLRTQWAWRLKWWTPLNDEEFIKWENLAPQLQAIFAVLTGFAKDPVWPPSGYPTYAPPKRFSLPASTEVGYGGFGFIPEGFVTLRALIVEYNLTRGWYDPIPNSLVRLTFSDPGTPFPSYKGTNTALSENAYLLWPFNSVYKFADENGTVIFHGLRPWYTYRIDAWKFDERDSSIIYAPDYGIYGAGAGAAGGISLATRIVAHPTYMSVPLFNCTEVTLFDLFDVKFIRRCSFTEHYQQGTVEVYDIRVKSVPIFYGTYFSPDYTVGMVFVKRGSRITITFKGEVKKGGWPIIVLTNSTKENPEGYGYYVTKPLRITHTIYKAAKDMYLMTSARYSKLKSKYIRNAGAENLLKEAASAFSKAERALKEKIYDECFSQSLITVSLVSRAYNESVMPLYNELSTFILFFASILLLFSILFERLVFHGEGKKRIITLLLVLIASFSILNFVNPAFEVMSNSIINILGVATSIFAIFIIVLFLGETKETIERAAEARLGKHIIKTERVSTLIYMLDVATENLRRRRLSTALTMTAIIAFCSALTAFTSATYVISVKEGSISWKMPYTGLMLKRSNGWPPNIYDKPIITYLKGIAGDGYVISPRIWLYPTSVYPTPNNVFFITPRGSKESPTIFLGMSEEEAKILFSKHITGPGFIPKSPYQCLVPKGLANYLNITVGDTLYVKNYNWNLKVMGIIESTIQTELTDFDGRSLLPLDPIFSNELSRVERGIPPGQIPRPISIDSVIVIPWTTAYKFGGFISSITIIPKYNVTQNDLFELGRKIALGTDSPVYVGHEEKSAVLSKSTSYYVIGWEVMWVLMAIAVLSITNFITSSVYSRKREIFIYSSLGMDPFGGVLMFLAEAVTYAILASVIGYLIGYGFNLLLIKMIPGAIFNISSLFILISLLAIILACIGSSIYPSLIASRIITPSLERKWKLPTKPKGDLWEIPFPLNFPKEEIMGLLVFLSEYYKGMGSLGHGYRIESEPKLDFKETALSMDVTILPSDLGVSMKSIFKAQFRDVNKYSFTIFLERKTGERGLWSSRVYPFIDSVRKQLLLWRSLPTSERNKYIKTALSHRGETSQL